MTGDDRFPLAPLEKVSCKGEWATAWSVWNAQDASRMYLFHYSGVGGHTHWRVVDIGPGLDCRNRHGVPADVARAINCGE